MFESVLADVFALCSGQTVLRLFSLNEILGSDLASHYQCKLVCEMLLIISINEFFKYIVHPSNRLVSVLLSSLPSREEHLVESLVLL